MKEFMRQFVKTECDVLVHDVEVIKALKVLNKHKINTDLSIRDCEWLGSPMWCIGFRATGKQIDRIKRELKNDDFTEILIVTDRNYYGKVETLYRREIES